MLQESKIWKLTTRFGQVDSGLTDRLAPRSLPRAWPIVQVHLVIFFHFLERVDKEQGRWAFLVDYKMSPRWFVKRSSRVILPDDAGRLSGGEFRIPDLAIGTEVIVHSLVMIKSRQW
jgi:hypothetical protein